eukprot:COSAG02_NODE_13214_length_1425_cov_1.275264_1_plen_345_part_00
MRDGLDGEPPLPAAPYSKEDCERIVAIAVCDCLLEERFVASSYSYTAYVQLGKKGIDVLSGAAELPSTLAWLSKAAADKKTAPGGGARAGGVAKKRKIAQCADPATAPPTVASERTKESANGMNQSAGTSVQSAAAAGKPMKSKLSLGSKNTKTNGRQKSSAKLERNKKRQPSNVDIREAFAQHHSLQEKAQQHQQRMYGNDRSGEYTHGTDGGSDDDIESCDSDDAELRKEVEKIEAVHARSQHAKTSVSGSKPLTTNVGASGARAVPANNSSRTTAPRKKRRAPVPCDDDEEAAEQDFDLDEAEFEAELRRAGGLAKSPEPTLDEDRNGDEAFDIGADSIFD